jgi:hypothetical protein
MLQASVLMMNFSLAVESYNRWRCGMASAMTAVLFNQVVTTLSRVMLLWKSLLPPACTSCNGSENSCGLSFFDPVRFIDGTGIT